MATINVETVLEQIRQLPRSEQNVLKQALTEDRLHKDELSHLPSRVISTGNKYIDRTPEYDWLNKHEQEYIGQWVALAGNELIAHSTQAKEVYQLAHQAGADEALVLFIENPHEPYIGW